MYLQSSSFIRETEVLTTRAPAGRLEQSKGADFMVDGLDGRWRENEQQRIVHGNMARKNNNEKKHVNNQKSISLCTGTELLRPRSK
jgi:hypothetical protein